MVGENLNVHLTSEVDLSKIYTMSVMFKPQKTSLKLYMQMKTLVLQQVSHF
jgi:hypothetical protein